MVSTIVNYYGVHWSPDGVAWLQQGRGASHAISLRERSPFTVQLPGHRRHCNHQINLASLVPNDYHWNFILQVINDPLLQAMMPVPKTDTGLYFLSDPDGIMSRLIACLARMSSPIYSAVNPIQQKDAKKILSDMEGSNIQTTAVTGADVSHTTLLNMVAKAAAQKPGKLFVAGDPMMVVPQGYRKITTTLDRFDFEELIQLPWETLGAVILKRYMRNEYPIVADALTELISLIPEAAS